MADKKDLERWVLEGIRANGGSATVVQVAKHIWAHHRDELELSGDLFFTWQYDMRWVAQTLRNRGALAPSPRGSRQWRLP
jgi:hypothetical protein